MFDLSWFLDLARTENMVDSAARCGVSQSTLSRRLAALESDAGSPLFHRRGRFLELNAQGRALAAAAQEAQDVWQRGIAEVRRLMDPERGTIRLAFMHSLGTWMVPDLVGAYRREHPQVQFQLFQGAARPLLDKVLEGEADVALVGPKPVEEIAAGRLGWIHLATQALALGVPDGHPFAGRDSISFAAAREQDFVGMLPGYGTRIIFDELAAEAGFEPNLVFESMELTTLAGLVAAGMGVALLPLGDPNFVVRGITLVPLEEPRHRELGMVWRRDGEAAGRMPAAEAFREFVAGRGV